MRLLLLAGAILLPIFSAFADDDIKWGDPVNGLKIGLVNAPTTATSDQIPTFTIIAQNVSQAPILVPTPDSFMLKDNPQSNDFHQSPISPILEKEAPQPPALREFPWSTSASGIPADKATTNVVSIAPGQSVTWESVPLEEHSYFGDRMPDGGKTDVKTWYLLPHYLFHLRFRFENEQKQVAGKSVWTGQADTGVADIQISAASLAGLNVKGAFTLPKQNYFLGEGIKATFTVTNNGDEVVRYLTGGDYRGSGRPERFSVSAVDEQGQPVPDPVPQNGLGGGLGSDASVEPGTSHTEDILVNQWCAFSKPGKYKVTLKRTLNFIRPDAPGTYRPETSLPSSSITTTLDVTIEDNPTALKAYLEALGNMLGLGAGSSANDRVYGPGADLLKSEALAKLPAAFPEIVKLLDGSPGMQGSAVEYLSYYGKDQAAPVLLEHTPKLAPVPRLNALRILSGWKVPEVEPLIATALRDKNDELRANTVYICADTKYDSCTPILLTMDSDSSSLVRRYLCAALGASGDPRAIPVLLKLLNDSGPDPYIKIWAADGLGKFKRTDGVSVMMKLLHDPKIRGDEGNVMQVLQNLTGENFNDNHTTWFEWWDKTGRAKYGKDE